MQPFPTIQTSDQVLNRVQANIANALNTATPSGSSSGSTSGNVPSGACVLYMGATYQSDGKTPNDPPGFLMCINGRSVSKSAYPDLFSAIGAACGSPDGSNFYLPQVDGRFPRFTDHGSGNDPDSSSRTAEAPGGNTGDNVGSDQGFANTLQEQANAVQVGSTGTGIATSDAEVRPINTYFNLIVKT